MLEFQSKQKVQKSTDGSQESEDGEESGFDEDRNVDFCVNVDIGGWDRHMKELKKVPDQFMCMTQPDIMRFARIQVLGVTTPQIYLKVKGNWTGGH